MKTIDAKYGFPLFTSIRAKSGMLKFEKNRVSDLWALLDFIIKTYLKGKNKRIELFMSSLLEQAKYFYKAAEVAPMRSQPLLYYYSFLNLSKVYLQIVENTSITDQYFHGIETKVCSTTTIQNAEIKILSLYGSPKISVAHRLMTSLGDTLNPHSSTVFLVKDFLASCVGIHRTYCETYNEKEEFIQLESPKCVKHGKVLSFESSLKNCDQNKASLLNANGYNVSHEGNTYIYRECLQMRYYSPSFNDWLNLSSQIQSKRVWSYTDGNQYKMYVAANNRLPLSNISIIYGLMFFLGSITRYSPYFFESLTSEKEQWLISEFLSTQPQQFLYYLISVLACKPIYKSRTVSL